MSTFCGSRKLFPPCANQLSIRSITPDRKSTRLNSSHSQISYPAFCLENSRTLLPHLTPAGAVPCRPAPHSQTPLVAVHRPRAQGRARKPRRPVPGAVAEPLLGHVPQL